MRSWILLSLVACAEPLRPPQQPADPNAVNGCRSVPTPLGGVRYACSTYELHDNALEPTSLRSIESQLVAGARTKGFESTTRVLDVKGAEDALVIEYRNPKDGWHAFDLLAMTPAGAKVRVFQCHVPWFENVRSLPTRQDTCMDSIGRLLERPAPAGLESTPDCKRATARLPTLPGRVEPADGSEELRTALIEFKARCTDKIAACALAAATYVEATLCRD